MLYPFCASLFSTSFQVIALLLRKLGHFGGISYSICGRICELSISLNTRIVIVWC